MKNSAVGEKAKRAMANAMLNEVLQMMERGGCDTISQADLIAHLEKFKEEMPEAELSQAVFADDEGAEIKSRFWGCGAISCDAHSLSLRNVGEQDREGFIRLQREYSPVRSLLKDEIFCQKLWDEHNENGSYSRRRGSIHAKFCVKQIDLLCGNKKPEKN